MQQDHIHVMKNIFTVVHLVVFGAVVTPSFEEHLLMIIILLAVKPTSLLISGSMAPLATTSHKTLDSHVSEILQQVVAASVSVAVHYLVHADRRRLWIASPRLLAPPTAAAATSSTTTTNEDGDDDADEAMQP